MKTKDFLKTRTTPQLWNLLAMYTRVNNWYMIGMVEAELKRRGIKLENRNDNS